MSTPNGRKALPGKAEAVGIIAQFTEGDPTAITDHIKLAEALGGMSAALSAVVLDYGKKHPLPRIKSNMGVWKVEIGTKADKHIVTAIEQDIHRRDGANIWRSAVAGGADMYFRYVAVPTEAIMRQFHNTDPPKLQKWAPDTPYWEDICAVATTTHQDGQTNQKYWPFHEPFAGSIEDDHLCTATENAIGYTRILQELSRTLLEIVE